jgi:putative FmdB family regulatory protein
MPLFDYVCSECKHRFEALVRKNDEKVECPKCKSEKTERQLASPAVHMGNPYVPKI